MEIKKNALYLRFYYGTSYVYTGPWCDLCNIYALASSGMEKMEVWLVNDRQREQ